MEGDCSGSEERANRYLDGEMSPAEAAQFEAHLAGCAACRRELAAARSLAALLAGLEEAPVPAGFAREVQAGLPRRQPWPAIRWVLVAQLAATALCLALAYPTLATAWRYLGEWFAPGRLLSLGVAFLAWVRLMGLRLAAGLDAVDLAWPRGWGLPWSQAVLAAALLLGFWLLGNRLLLSAEPTRGGGRDER